MKHLLIAFLAVVASAHADVTIGKPAPDFTLAAWNGNTVSLEAQKGKVVVLEWINHGCPFVAKHYDSGNMQKLQKEATDKGVVWLSICSSAPGKPGHMSAAAAAKSCADNGAAATAYLLDEEGTVGKLYGAKRTPEMYVIDANGVLVYHGAIDDKSSTNSKDIDGAKNYVMAAANEVLTGNPVTIPTTSAYGCGIKYKD